MNIRDFQTDNQLRLKTKGVAMNRLLSDEEGKKIVKYSGILFFMSAAVCITYILLSHPLIRSMYNGTSISILNNLIKYQSTKPVDHYLALADRIFYKYWIYFGVALPLLVIISRFLNLRQTLKICQLEPQTTDLPGNAVWKRGDIITIAILSLAIRAFFLPFVIDLPTAGDATYYWQVPKFLANGEFSSTVLRPPLWGYMLAIPAFIYDHIISGRILAVIIGSCAPVLVYLLAARVFNRKTALIAGLLYVFFPTHIGYSHSLWAELFFGVLVLLSTLFFFIFIEDTKKKKYFVLCFATAGLALLAKEFAVILFAGLFLTLFFLKVENKYKKLALAAVLFMTPAFAYSVTASCLTKKVIVLNDAIILNFQAGAGIWGQYSFENREENVSDLLGTLKKRGVAGTVENSIMQASNLWAPKSYISTRIASQPKPGWDYGIENPKPLIYLIAGYYVFLVLTAIPGICMAENGTFKWFSIACLFLLTSTCVLALLVSRYRLPFMFIIVIYSAHLLAQGVTLLGSKKRFLSIIIALVLIIMFVDVVISKLPDLGQWG